MTTSNIDISRRRLLRLLVAAPFASVLAAEFLAADEASAAEALLAATASGRNQTPTPECGDDDEPTPSATAGPFYKPRSPERSSLIEPDMKGTPLELGGRVYGRNCKPLAGALVDFWHCDDDGLYDNDGFRLRGHQFTDAQGRYRLTTIVPGVYTGRTRHIHVRVQPRSGRVLTTQLYFPDEKRNRGDGLFRAELLMSVDAASTPRQGRFHFLLDA
ncbi:MAG TPA: intradiol ring-cleavage dioxygenase [Methylomirabilota bacterium]|nr:intradiol ring-cleavage dioxygenase [Methylomirabilota bacterium]